MTNVDTSIQGFLTSVSEERSKSRRLETGGGPPHDGGMEARIAKLEAAVDHIKTDISDIKTDVRKVRDNGDAAQKDVSYIRGRLDSMPTTFQMVVTFITIAIALTGLVFTIARLVR